MLKLGRKGGKNYLVIKYVVLHLSNIFESEIIFFKILITSSSSLKLSKNIHHSDWTEGQIEIEFFKLCYFKYHI